MKRQGFTLLDAFCMAASLLVVAAILFPVLARPHGGEGYRSTCQQHLKLIALAMKQYVQDCDEKYPPTALAKVADSKHIYGWADAIARYLPEHDNFFCPNAVEVTRNATDPMKAGYTDYWFNRNIATVSEASLNYVANTILFAEGNTGGDATNARYNYSSIPRPWLRSSNAPCRRHLGGANYAFADGHVKWLKPPVLSTKPAMQSISTFGT